MSTTLTRTRAQTRHDRRRRRHMRMRRKLYGTPDRPRLVVFRSHRNIEGQIVDDTTQRTLLGVSTLAAEIRSLAKNGEGAAKGDRAKAAGKLLAERCRAKGIERIVFDRAGYKYHGRIRAFAEGAREGGLKF
ncbi:MAG: 50S ribosomal protein L18 [Gemmatimonadetes bacterium]|nr:50S ribosomal protein L18 [Gemmatimonadota bacterium]